MIPQKKGYRQAGFTYLAVILSVVLIGVSLSAALQQWSTVMKREREAELLFRGDQIRRAIAMYYMRPGVKKFPRKFEDLVKATDKLSTKRYLRKLYKDPMTKGEWGLVKMGAGIRGVYSLSQETPLKKGNFPPQYETFEGKTSYREWVFQVDPAIAQAGSAASTQQGRSLRTTGQPKPPSTP